MIFIRSGVGFCQRLFQHLLRGHAVFVLQFANVVYHNDGFVNIEERLHPWDKSHLMMMYNPFNVLLDVVCQYFVEDICIDVQQ